MLQAEEARAKVYAVKRKGELRTQALLRACVRGAASEDDIRAAAEAFEAAADGGGGGGGGVRVGRRGVVLGGGAPRSTVESWTEKVCLVEVFKSGLDHAWDCLSRRRDMHFCFWVTDY